MVWRAATAVLAAWCLSACARSAAQQPYDLVITGGSVLNGEGAPAVRADVGIRAGRIAAIGDLAAAAATRRIDASGLTVDPIEEWPEFRHRSRPEFLQTLPHVHGTSGFFVARLRV